MDTFIIKFVTIINSINELLFSKIDVFIEELGFNHWITHSIIECVHMLPFLFLIFVLIEIFEYHYAGKISNIAKHSKKLGPIAGSLAASFPQCGFSVIASTLYSKRYITKGTLLAVYLATSDEAIPILLSSPAQISLVIPLLLTKIIIAIVAGYCVDLIYQNQTLGENNNTINTDDEGCCHHDLTKPNIKDIILHPIVHTINVSIFVFIVCLVINYLVVTAGGPEEISKYFLNNTIFQPILTAIAGLIPTCAVSVALTMLYIKGAISFGSVISGLCSSAGLGLLVLFKKNRPIKDSIVITLILLITSILVGILIQLIYK